MALKLHTVPAPYGKKSATYPIGVPSEKVAAIPRGGPEDFPIGAGAALKISP